MAVSTPGEEQFLVGVTAMSQMFLVMKSSTWKSLGGATYLGRIKIEVLHKILAALANMEICSKSWEGTIGKGWRRTAALKP